MNSYIYFYKLKSFNHWSLFINLYYTIILMILIIRLNFKTNKHNFNNNGYNHKTHKKKS